jgi:RimJ/RimL family protein N-acetyltransferase
LEDLGINKLTFEWCHDPALIRRIMTHPKLYSWLTDDTAGPVSGFTPPMDFSYVLVKREGDILGLFAIHPRNSVCWEIHTALLPHCWGPLATRAYREGLAWLRATTPCRKVIGNIRASNRLALRIAERAGLQRIGLNTKCVMKDGILQDQWILGMEL